MPDLIDLRSESPAPSRPNVVPAKVVVPFTRLIALLGICLVVTAFLLVILLIILVVIVQWKRRTNYLSERLSEELPLTGKGRTKTRIFLRGEVNYVYMY